MSPVEMVIVGAIGALVVALLGKWLRPNATPLEILDQVQEERDGMRDDLRDLRAEVRTTRAEVDGLLTDLRTERAVSAAWRAEAIARRDDMTRAQLHVPPLPDGLA